MENVVFERDNLWNVIKRLHAENDGVIFKSKDETFKIMIRNDPEGGAGRFAVVELVIVVDDSEDDLYDVLELDSNGWWDDEDESSYIVESWEFDRKEPDEAELDEMFEYVNKVYNYVFCPCGKYFIKDGKDLCFFCELTSTEEKLKKFECPICMDEGHEMHSKTMKCCSNKIHINCHKQWYNKGNKKCAICRADLPKEPRTNRLHIDADVIDSIASSIARAVDNATRNGRMDDEETSDDESIESVD
jgi:hypothetical protein